MRLGLLLSALAACGCDPSPDEACADQATARCALLDRCTHHGSFAYGGYGACVTRLRARCNGEVAAPGGAAGVVSVEVCAHALATVGCDAFRSGDPAPECRAPAGGLGEGAGCAFDSQCATAWCRIPAGAGCGRCVPPTTDGDGCADGACSRGLGCGADAVCRTFASDGAPCDATRPCAPGLACVGSSATLLGACGRFAAAGEPCDPASIAAADCDAALGLFCDGGICRAVSGALSGAPCGRGIECPAGDSCFDTCLPDGTDGASCDPDHGPGCRAPASCVGGRCTFPDAPACE
jgi:hypothetical protein